MTPGAGVPPGAGEPPGAGAPFVRTVLGDVAASSLGITYSHEHLVIDCGGAVALDVDFLLDDVERMVGELAEAIALGLRSVVDAMPADAGRNVGKLAEIARRTGVNVVAPTGVHHPRFYPDDHWSNRLTKAELTELFIADVVDGIDELDYSAPVVRRTEHRAGVVKVAGVDGGLGERECTIFAAAAAAHTATGVPILTHCEKGSGALEQIRFLSDRGVDPAHVVVSHVDKVVDREYHRDIAATGAVLEYDGAFRWGDKENGTLTLLGWMVEDGRTDSVVLGLDAARRSYLRAWGGRPGLRFLLGEFREAMTERGIDDDIQRRFFVANPARAFAFASPGGRVTEPRP